MENNYCVRTRGLTKKYSKFTLGALDLDIPEGFSTALIGANGAGKTTLIDILCGVTHRTDGEVTYFGDSRDISDPNLRERIGYCASSAFFPLGFTAKDIAVSMEIAYKSFDRAKFAELCEKFEVDSENTKKPRPMHKQSDGNRMRTCLASVFARSTELLVLDEPGSSLDPLMRDRLCDRMREYLDDGDGRKSIIFSTHNIADMENAADYAVFMDKGHVIEQGFIEELKEKSDNCPDNIELHRPYVDAVTCKCPKCQGTMKRVPEVIDCWFDSGSMPFAQHHYPFENKELFEQQFPAKFISEAVDQTRGWFYSLLAISTLLFNKAPYENVIVLGHVQDADGQKMSKSKGNAVDPFDALQKHGADAIRWYFYENSAPWVPNRFKDEWVSEGQRKFMGTFWNTYAFFVLYANIDNFDATKYQLEYDKLSVMDKWLLSKLNSLVKFVDTNLENYKITETARALEDFTDELSNWYVRRSRERFWAKGMEQDKINAYMTLYTTLVTLAKISAPMVPFMTESIYRNLVCSIDKNAPISIHLCDFPKVNEQFIDKKLEETMDDVLDAVVIGRACRNSTNIKNRQPIGKMFIKADWKLDEFYTAIIADELNVKEVEYTDDVRAFTSYSFKPQMKTLGPKYGKLLNAIRTALTEVDGNATMDKLNESGSFKLNVEGQAIELSKDDVLIEMTQKEGFVASSDKGITVVLDTNLTPELIEEGFVREVISKVQTMRKDAGFEVMDKINLYVSGNDKIADIVNKNAAQVKTVVLAQDIITGKTAGFEKEWDINGEKVTLAVEKLA